MSTIEWCASSRTLYVRLRTIAALMTAVSLAACGGGGGGDSAPPPPVPPPATPTLSVKADAASTSSSGQSVGLHATLANASGTPTWTLAGEGSLSATSGDDITYVPPDSETFDGADTITVTATLGSLSQQVQIALQAVTVPGHRWSVAHAADVIWNDVAYGNGEFVAVGHHGGLATSADGVQWTRHDVPFDKVWRSVAYGASGGWVALGENGELMDSADGVSWTSEPTLPVTRTGSPRMNKVTYANGVYVAVGDIGSFTSSDGKTWTDTHLYLHWAAAGAGLVVAQPTSGLVATANGANWPANGANSPWPAPAGVGGATVLDSIYGYGNVVFGNNVFVAFDGTNLYRSSDGANWTTETTSLPASAMSARLVFVGGTFFVGGLSSVDGLNWVTAPTALGYLYAGATSDDGSAVAVINGSVLSSGPTLAALTTFGNSDMGDPLGVAYANGRYLMPMEFGNLLTSTDGSTWSSVDFPTMPDGGTFSPGPIKVGPDGTIVVTGFGDGPSEVAQYNAYALSSDGVNWTYATTPQPDPNTMDFVFDMVYDGQRWVSVSLTGEIDASPTGSAWTKLYSFSAAYAAQSWAIAYGNGRYVLTNQDGFVAVSPDAVNWTTAPTVMDTAAPPAPFNFRSILFDGKRFVAVGDGGYRATSTDGMSWNFSSTATSQNLYSVAYSKTTGELVAVGAQGVTESSVDGVHWTMRASLTTRALGPVVATPTGFIAVGEDGFVELSSN